jgi:hypothetical protein
MPRGREPVEKGVAASHFRLSLTLRSCWLVGKDNDAGTDRLDVYKSQCGRVAPVPEETLTATQNDGSPLA